jgi:amino acid transporter
VFEASLYGLFAFFANQWFSQNFGVNIPWPVFAVAAVALCAVLSYRDVKVSAAVLGIALVLEVVILAIFAWGVFTAPSGTSISTESLNVFAVMTPVSEQTVNGTAIAAGAAAVGIFMAFWSWVGFEMAPNYAEESRNPKSTIPLSLYISVIGLGIFYIIVSWAAVSAYPSEGEMLAKAVSDSANFFLGPMETFVGGWAKQLMFILILTSSFACGMAFHNTAARYMYSLGREGVIPSALGKTHPEFKSPHIASFVQSALALLWIVLVAVLAGMNDPTAQAFIILYTMLAILGTGLLLTLQALVSIAIIVWFQKNGGGNIITTMIAPAIAFLSQIYLVYLLVGNLATFGGSGSFGSNIPYIAAGILLVGLIWGFVLRGTNPTAYRNIGHMVNND